jgi:cephalosporin hydroxylase
MAARILFLVLSVLVADALLLRNATPASAVNLVAANATHKGVTFGDFYASYGAGRGIWKWSNALDAYQRHFGMWAGQPVSIAEVGVQSGGSINLWKGVLGAATTVHGIDINTNCEKFADATTTITIGDQADVNMWHSFFTDVAPNNLDVLIDDGGHEPHQMLVTLEQVYPHTKPGGYVMIEDIHGQNYIKSFFTPAANFLGAQAVMGSLGSVHVYPFLLAVQKKGPHPAFPATELAFAGSSVTVDNFDSMWKEVPNHRGGHIILENPTWGPFLTAPGMTNFFSLFAGLHDFGQYDSPAGCATSTAPQCTAAIQNSQMQAQITGIHVYPTRLVVEVAGSQVTIQAVRKGTEWIGYGF